MHFTQKHLDLPIRLGLNFEIFRGNSLGLQYELQYNFALRTESLHSGNGTAISGSLYYDYTLTNRTRNYVSNIISMYLKTQLRKQL